MEIKTIASGSKGNAHLITCGNTILLLDAGAPFKEIQEATDFSVSKIDACFVTHRHGDHSKAIPEFLRRGIKVYATLDTAEKYEGAIGLEKYAGLWVKDLYVKCFDVPHDVPCLGYLVTKPQKDKLLYIVDAEYVPYTFKGLTHIMLEANHSREAIMERAKDGKLPLKLAERILKNHMSIEAAMTFIKKNDMSRLKEIHLLHLSDDHSDADRFKCLIQEETGALVYVK